MAKVWVVSFWKMDEPYRFNSEFTDGAEASDFVVLKQSQHYIVNVVIEDHKDKHRLKKLLKKIMEAIGSGFMNAGGGL